MGNDDDQVDLLAASLLGAFHEALSPLVNDRGGIFRAGTGSAMYYVAHAAQLGATPDGRKAHEYLSANLAPSLGVKVRGPLSLLRSFTKLPLRQAINGGPVTIEVHDTVFRTPGSVEKVAMLVQSFVRDGGHQLQINALNRDVLLDAQEHPELHRNLIVRVWGWSAYFVELDKEYQDQIIQRVELVP
jgi:formate C-acetyltransferase